MAMELSAPFQLRLSCLFRGALLVGLYAASSVATNCSADPLVLPLTNVTFPDGVAVNRGIRLVLGGQVQGLRMSTVLNNTRVRNLLDCASNSTGLTSCEGASSSVYSTTAGSFKQVYNLKDWNVTTVDPRPIDGTTVLQGYDVGNFTDAPAVISDLPIEVWAKHDALNKSALALGPRSSVLQRFIDNNLAPSSAFSIDYGSRSELHPRDGQVIFGGVNAGRHDSTIKAVFPMWGYAAPINCPLQVLLTDVILTNANGNYSLFDDPDAKVTACVDTIQNAFTWTPAMFATWQNLTRWVASDADGSYTPQTYPSNRETSIGTLTIKLANGLTTIIPHYELVSHERGTDPQGKYSVVNNSRIMAAVQTGNSDLGDNVPILGGVFLSQNYLHVDYPASTFWLSPQVGNGTFPDRITTSCIPSNTTTAGNGSSSGGNSNLALQIALPVVFVILAIGLLAYFMVRRNKHNAAKTREKDASRTPWKRDDDEEHGMTVSRREHRTSELLGDLPEIRRVSEIQGNELPIHKDDVVVDIDPLSPAPELWRETNNAQKM